MKESLNAEKTLKSSVAVSHPFELPGSWQLNIMPAGHEQAPVVANVPEKTSRVLFLGGHFLQATLNHLPVIPIPC